MNVFEYRCWWFRCLRCRGFLVSVSDRRRAVANPVRSVATVPALATVKIVRCWQYCCSSLACHWKILSTSCAFPGTAAIQNLYTVSVQRTATGSGNRSSVVSYARFWICHSDRELFQPCVHRLAWPQTVAAPWWLDSRWYSRGAS